MTGERYSLGLLDEDVSRRKFLGLAAGGAAALSLSPILAACGSEESEELDTLTWALNSPVQALNQYRSTDGVTMEALANVLEGPLSLNEDFKISPELGLADDWSQIDELTYAYQLRDGITFWDGQPVTVDDVVFSIEQHADPAVGSAQNSFYASVESVKATGTNEVTVKLNTPDALFRYTPAIHARYIIERKFGEANWKKLGSPSVLTMGTGPFRVEEFLPDESLTLVRNDAYWGDKPELKKLILRFIPEPATRLLAMRSGEIDGAFDVEPADQWEAIEGVTVQYTSAFRVFMMSLDVANPPFDDVHSRRALAYALDKEGLVEAVLQGHGRVATAIPEPGLWHDMLTEDEVDELYASLPSYAFDLDRARNEVGQSKYSDGFEFTATTSGELYPRVLKAAQTLQENLRQIGVTMDINDVTGDQFFPQLLAHEDLGAQLLEANTDYPDASNNVYLAVHGKFAGPNGFNAANYKNSQVDERLDLVQASTDEAARGKALAEIIRILAEDLPWIPVWWGDLGVATRSGLTYEGLNGFYRMQPWATRIRAA